jgi:hypothetical protein
MQKVQPISRGATCLNEVEAKDCTVRALANAGEMPYAEAHAVLKKHGRKERKGAFFNTMKAAYEEAGFVLEGVYGTTSAARFVSNESNRTARRGITLGNLISSLVSGNYIVNTTGHAVAVVNGRIIDTFDNPAGKRVISVFKKV